MHALIILVMDCIVHIVDRLCWLYTNNKCYWLDMHWKKIYSVLHPGQLSLMQDNQILLFNIRLYRLMHLKYQGYFVVILKVIVLLQIIPLWSSYVSKISEMLRLDGRAGNNIYFYQTCIPIAKT